LDLSEICAVVAGFGNVELGERDELEVVEHELAWALCAA
jgi:hypothetical protein